MMIHSKFTKAAVTFCAALSVPAVAADDKIDDVCRFTYDQYYLPLKARFTSPDPIVMQIECLSLADKMAAGEQINSDIRELLKQMRIDTKNYRQVVANAIQFACVRNSTGIEAFSYAEYKRSQCGDLTARRKAR